MRSLPEGNMKLLLIGPQGSGKSTQAKQLSHLINIPAVSTGEIFRKMTEQDSDEGRRIKDILAKGELVDDQTTAQIVETMLKDPEYQNGFVLDGYPRTLKQRELYDPQFDKVIYLKLSDQEIMDRLLKRGREDDTQELIKTRLDLYKEQTQPLLDYYKNLGILIEIDGSNSVDEVWAEIKSVVN